MKVLVTAFARNPSAVTQRSDRLRVVQGDARDPESIDGAMHGQDAVLVAFGPRSLKKDDVQEAFMRNLIAAMTDAPRRSGGIHSGGADEPTMGQKVRSRRLLRTTQDHDFWR